MPPNGFLLSMGNTDEESGGTREVMERPSKSRISPARVRVPPPTSNNYDGDEDKKLMDSEEDGNLEHIEPIIKYLKVLVEEYPKPINQTEIAQRAGVSKALVSRYRKNIQVFCDLETMAYKKKYILKEDDDTFTVVFVSSLMYDDYSFVQSLLKSTYFDKLISIEKTYEYLSSSLNNYYFKNYFSFDDVNWIFMHLKKLIISFNDEYDAEYYDNKDERNEEYDLTTLEFLRLILDARKKGRENALTFLIIDKIIKLSSFIIDINNMFISENIFFHIFDIRDKIYNLIIYNMQHNPTYLDEIIKDLDIEDKKDYKCAIKGMEIILKYSVDKIFANFTESIFSEAENKNIIIDPQYRTVKLIEAI